MKETCWFRLSLIICWYIDCYISICWNNCDSVVLSCRLSSRVSLSVVSPILGCQYRLAVDDILLLHLILWWILKLFLSFLFLSLYLSLTRGARFEITWLRELLHLWLVSYYPCRSLDRFSISRHVQGNVYISLWLFLELAHFEFHLNKS